MFLMYEMCKKGKSIEIEGKVSWGWREGRIGLEWEITNGYKVSF